MPRHKGTKGFERPDALPRNPQSVAFTLIEIMLVVAILAIALTFSYPAIKEAVQRAPMTQAVKDVMDCCRHARSQAILTGHPMELRFYPKEHRIEVAQAPADVGSSTGGSPVQTLGDDADSSSRSPGSARVPQSPFISTATLSDEIRIEMLDVNFTECKDFDGVVPVIFYPNGTCDEMTLVLHSDLDYRKISLEVVTSLAQVETDVNNFNAN